MAKPKTKGPPIQVRLPLDVDAAVRRQADSTGNTPAAVVEHIVDRTYRQATRSAGGQTAEITPTAARIGTDDPTCTHPKPKRRVTSSSGLHRCECGATRGVDGTWR